MSLDKESDYDEATEIEFDGDIHVGLSFSSEEEAVLIVEKWSTKVLCPLAKIRSRKAKEGVKGRRCFGCPHGIVRTSKAEHKRPCQRVKYTGCPVKININEQDDGSWLVTACVLEHVGHPVTEANFYSHQQAKKLDDENKEFVKGLMRARTNPRNIADVLSERTGKPYKTQDVRNLITRIRESEDKANSVEDALGHIRDNGGDVRYLKEQGTNNVDVLWIQTRDMRSQLEKCKPQVFECDTTFGTQVEGYKLYIPTFHSNHTDKWEVAGIMFLSTETKEKVHEGVKFFKASLPYKIEDGVTKFIFLTDKDFDYIEVSKNLFM